MIRLIAGLGNPGQKYAGTRHNVGFEYVDEVAAKLGVAFKSDTRFHGNVTAPGPQYPKLRLLKPNTFMNLSGQAIQALAAYFEILPEEILVVHDELDLTPGVARLKLGGGHGGHNGLRSTAQHLGSEAFARLRIGIGHPGSADQVTPFVLSKPSPEDRKLMTDAIECALQVLPEILAGDFQRAMTSLHSGAPGDQGV